MPRLSLVEAPSSRRPVPVMSRWPAGAADDNSFVAVITAQRAAWSLHLQLEQWPGLTCQKLRFENHQGNLTGTQNL